MADHFAAYSFVDRITEFEPGRRAIGSYAVPAHIAAFPSCLVAEAVGQLAAWVAMEHVGFRGRPVAALANETRFHADVAPGDALTLAVEIDSCDEHAVAYSGRASVGATTVIELIDCLGPMLPVEEFDAPEALAARFALLRGAGAPAGAFGGVSAPRVVRHGGVAGTERRARRCTCPNPRRSSATIFPAAPYSPRRCCSMRRSASRWRSRPRRRHWPAGNSPAPARMTHVKMRSFIPPGAALEIEAELTPTAADGATIRLTARMDDKIAATARLDVVARPASP